MSDDLKVPIDFLAVQPDERGVRSITPTDVSQFLRLEQCRRYLRLRLHSRAHGQKFMEAYDVRPQSIPPLLTRSGAQFERATEAAVPAELRRDMAAERSRVRGRPSDNHQVVQIARDLPRGTTRVLFQPRLMAELGSWRLRGDIDILRLERDSVGCLQLLVADMKSSASAKVEHRLQVAFYHEMLATILANAGVDHAPIEMAILYRGPVGDDAGISAEERDLHEAQRDAARRRLWSESALLEVVADPEHYIGAVRDLVSGAGSVAQQVAETEFEDLPWHLTYKCDGCIYNEFCMKWAAENDDISLLPHVSSTDKAALNNLGIRTTRDLVGLRVPSADDIRTLQSAPGAEKLNRQIAATWPIGPKIDALVHRARAYRRHQGDDLSTVSYLPNTGHGSLPYCDANHNPNLVRVYIDAQHDYLHDRVYLLGALISASEGGEDDETRRRSIVHLTDGPPSCADAEERLYLLWIQETMTAVRALAAPDEQGEHHAPVHLIFFDSYAQRVVMEGLSRHLGKVLGATPLYDFMTQVAAFDSPVVSLLEQEIRERRNFPMVCQSLQSVAAYQGFDWRSPEDYRKLFRARLFDFWGALGEDDAGKRVEWYMSRARFSSQVPLEYAYAAWGDLDNPSEPGAGQDYRRYREATVARLKGFAARRLEAIEHIARGFHGNDRTTKSSFDLTALDRFVNRAESLAEALCEFVTIERHVEVADWKRARLMRPEQRVLTGESLIVRYLEEDQDPGIAERNREHQHRQELWEHYAGEYREANPEATRVTLSRAQREETKWDAAGMQFRLRISSDGVERDLGELLSSPVFGIGDRIVLYPRWAVDSRLPEAEQTPFQPTPKQMLGGMRAEVVGIETTSDASGSPIGFVRVQITGSMRGVRNGFLFSAHNHPLQHGDRYTLDPNPSNIYAYWQLKVVEGLRDGNRHELYRRLNESGGASMAWPPEAVAGQRRFLEGLAALRDADELHDFGPAQRDYIGVRGADPILLVQGPPGTGKSYATAFAVFARMQGALAADSDYRVVASCKTHAATDVLLSAVAEVRAKLYAWRSSRPDVFSDYFDERLLDIPLIRLQARNDVPTDIISLHTSDFEGKGAGKATDPILAARRCFVASAPGGIYQLLNKSYGGKLFGHEFVDCLILDEASQMNLPEALMASLPLNEHGQVIVVGDHRQMPPIVHHDWEAEPQRTFQEYQIYQSLFDTLRSQGLEMVQFDESFRLHRDMAEFLRQEIYSHDGINFHAKHCHRLDPIVDADPLVQAVLDPAYSIVVVVHDESRSQVSNPFEQALVEPILRALAGAYQDPAEIVHERIGVVVPHRAQRAAVQTGVPEVALRDPETGVVVQSAVDTVERFQGGERDAIVVSATESDPDYLLISSKFLLDPRRLTVAISRARRKLILVASRSVFNIISADEATFQNVQIWKNLLRTTCTDRLWSGERDWQGNSIVVEAWGKRSDS